MGFNLTMQLVIKSSLGPRTTITWCPVSPLRTLERVQAGGIFLSASEVGMDGGGSNGSDRCTNTGTLL